MYDSMSLRMFRFDGVHIPSILDSLSSLCEIFEESFDQRERRLLKGLK
jgi:hypothetical protein